MVDERRSERSILAIGALPSIEWDELASRIDEAALRLTNGTVSVVAAHRVADADLVVALGNAQAHPDGTLLAQARDRLLPVLPIWQEGRFEDSFPESVRELNGLLVGDDETRLVHRVLELLGLSDSDRQAFVSYRRSDGTRIASQLRHELLGASWSVFLDRYDVPPGVDFQRELDRSLYDKEFVILLETPEAIHSEWTRHEVAFAFERSLAILAVNVPGADGTRNRFASVPEAHRLELEPEDVRWPEDGDPQLTDQALRRLLVHAEDTYISAMRLRRERLVDSVRCAVHELGGETRVRDRWEVLATFEDRELLVLVVPRPPAPIELRQVHEAARLLRRTRGRRVDPWVVHPLHDIDEDRLSLTTWLIGRRRLAVTPVMMLRDRIRA